MKKYLIYTMALAFALVSCEEEPLVYDNKNLNESLLSFERSSADLSVLLGSGSETYDAVVEVSTVSNADRVFDVTVVTEESTASPAFYSVGNSVTIPAGSYEGVLTITGNDIPSLTPSATTIVLELSQIDNVVFENQRSTISIFKVCPVPEDFLVGAYDVIPLSNTSSTAFAGSGFVSNVTGPDGLGTSLVTLEVGDTQTQRTFQAKLFVRASSASRKVTLSLVCNQINLASRTNVGFANFFFDPSNNPTSYDLSDDSQVFINYIDNPEGAFGGPTDENGSFVLIKQ
jgi:hypothetical protein